MASSKPPPNAATPGKSRIPVSGKVVGSALCVATLATDLVAVGSTGQLQLLASAQDGLRHLLVLKSQVNPETHSVSVVHPLLHPTTVLTVKDSDA